MLEPSLHPVLGIEWRAPALPPRGVPEHEAEARAKVGMVPAVLGYLEDVPWAARCFLDNLGLRFSHTDPAVVRLIALVASHENSCRHCYGAQRALLKVQGFSDHEIERLESDAELAELSPAGRAALRLVRNLARSTPRPSGSAAAELRALGMSAEAVAEVAGECANWCMGNRLSTCLAVPPDPVEQKVQSLLGRLLRPLIASQIRKSQRPVPPPPPFRTGAVPYDLLLEPLQRTHVGVFFRNTLEGAFASELLPRRAKFLMIGVVARSLGCTACETGARAHLAAEGVAEGTVRGALEHLDSSGCDETERLLLPFARASVRYRPAEIQDEARALVAALGPARAVEAIATAALANALVRLAMLQS